MATITLPESIKAIGYGAFDSNKLTLTTVYCKASIPPTLYKEYAGGIVADWDDERIDCNWFTDSFIPKIYVPKAAVGAYKQAKGWRKYASKIEGYNF